MKNNKIKNNWYETFFDKYYMPLYLKKGVFSAILAEQEVNFVVKVLNLPKNSKILDMPCGQGRHSVILAKNGYVVTGVDLSMPMLYLAKRLIKKEKTSARLILNDMRKISFKNEFDAVINLFTSFGYFAREKDNRKVLKNINRALKPEGKFVLDLLNKNRFFEKISTPRTWWESGSSYILENHSFDANKKIWLNHIVIISSVGTVNHTYTFVRLYDLPEIKKLLKETDFKVLKIYGDYQGNKFTNRSPRMIVLAQKLK